MDLTTLNTLAEQLSPLVLQKIRGKGKKEVSELTTVSDYNNVYSMPAFYWNKQTGEKKAVNVSMSDLQTHIQEVANENLVEIKQQASEANTAAQNSADSAAASAASAKNSEDYALAQKNDTIEYLGTVREEEAERMAAEAIRINNENTRKKNETTRASQENTRIANEEERTSWFTNIKSSVSDWFSTTKLDWTSWFERVKSLWSSLKTEVIEATDSAVDAADNANNMANHPPYVGDDLYWYVWNNDTKTYDKTDKYSKGDGFSIKKTFASIAEMEAYVNPSTATTDNPILTLGDFVMISSDVEDEDNSKLYVVTSVTSSAITYGFMTDMSGARGFTGHTPQLSIGTITTGAAGTLANVSLSENGTDENGNPKYLINFVIPKGDKGEKGDAFTYDDFTAEQIATLQKPATDAASLANAAAELATSKASLADSAATTATEKAALANSMATKADTAATNANNKATLADSAASNANEKAELATTAAENANEKAGLANDAADNANDLASHPNIVLDNGNWGKWNTETQQYEDTGSPSTGAFAYPKFKVRRGYLLFEDKTGTLGSNFYIKRGRLVALCADVVS